MYQIIIENYENVQSVLIKENEEIRTYLKYLQDQFKEVLSDNSTGEQLISKPFFFDKRLPSF